MDTLPIPSDWNPIRCSKRLEALDCPLFGASFTRGIIIALVFRYLAPLALSHNDWGATTGYGAIIMSTMDSIAGCNRAGIRGGATATRIFK